MNHACTLYELWPNFAEFSQNCCERVRTTRELPYHLGYRGRLPASQSLKGSTGSPTRVHAAHLPRRGPMTLAEAAEPEAER